MTAWENETAFNIEQSGLALSLEGDSSTAHRIFTIAQSLLGPEDTLEIGHLQRDWTRVHAGLGYITARDEAIEQALVLHSADFEQITEEHESYPTVASELGATLGVAARVELADVIDDNGGSVDDMADYWEEALDLLYQPDTNKGYLHQVLTHGSLGLTTFGTRKYKGLAEKFLSLSKHEESEMIKEQKLLISAAKLASMSPLKSLVKPVAVKFVAGPYRIAR